MNLPYWIIGVLAGLVSALLFFSASSGSTLASLIIYLTPLPLFIAGLGWGQRALGLALLTGTVFLTAVASLPVAGIFLAIDGLLPYVLCQRALLFRETGLMAPASASGAAPNATHDGSAIEWYPAGHLLIWAAGIAAALILAVDILLRFTGYPEGLQQAVAEMLRIYLVEPGVLAKTLQDINSPLSAEDVANSVRAVLPSASLIVWTLAMLGNMWLAQIAVTRSAHAIRPSPAYSYVILPRSLSYVWLAALVLACLPGPLAYVAIAVAVILTLPYFLLGLAVIHVISRRWSVRGLFLGIFYALLLFVGWLAIPVSLLGMLEPWLGLRARSLQQAPDRD
ncbi:MAG: DUF2232 domain-containing protein [Parvibaculaceae bacterium]|nr:DUF2232 domain-containing protein [Parvibaculaceae bacterium]